MNVNVNCICTPAQNAASASGQTQNLLAKIIEHTRQELSANGLLGADASVGFERPQAFGPVRDFGAALAAKGTRFIFECKRQSPSKGPLRTGSVTDFIRAYDGIADAISVLTEPRYFGGSLADLREARLATETPLLRKDFIIDPVQVAQAYAHGADAVLLMLSVLGDETYSRCAQTAQQFGLHILTEVHDAQEMARACALDAKIIGINNRDLRSLDIDLAVTEKLRALMTGVRLCISESGIRTHADVQALAPLVDGFLVGSSLMQAPRLDLAARELAFGAVKICGLISPDAARAAYKAGAVWGGLIFVEASKRCVSMQYARTIMAAAPLQYVGVFITQDIHEILDHVAQLGLCAVQLHGDYSQAVIEQLNRLLPAHVEIWSVHKVADNAQHLPMIDGLHSENPRRFRELYDSAGPQAGGNGIRFDWSLLNQHPSPSAVVLAGGLNVSNIAQARNTGVGLLDVNSGVESTPGIKDGRKLATLFNAMRTGAGQEK